MSTISDNQIEVGGARDLLKASMKLYVETLERDEHIGLLKKLGAINYHEDLSRKSGSTVTIYNSPRRNSKGTVGDHDRYSNSTPPESGDRTVQIRLFSDTAQYALEGSERQQISEFDLKGRVPKQQAEWMKCFLLSQWLNQACGNTATSISAPDVADEAFTTAAELNLITGNNAAIAPSARYKAIGALGTGSITVDENIDADNTLKLADFMAAREVINSTDLGIPTWNRLKKKVFGKYVDGIAIVSTTGMNQLKLDAKAAGNNLVFSELQYASMAGGKEFALPSGTYWMENMLFVEMPDHYLARGVNSSTSAAVANTRRAVILGADAIDFAVGKGFAYKGSTVPGFEVAIDEDRDKLNKIGYASVSANCGAKKVQISGTGSNASTSFDLGTYVISHYSAT